MKQALADALQQRGYETLTPVQEAVTDPDLGTADLLVSAQTGSGKTVGFGLALGPTLLGDDETFGPAGKPLALVIAPTRELAMQVMRELMWLYANANAQVTSCVGGMDMRDERRALSRGAHIVVATPGRLRDHIMRGPLICLASALLFWTKPTKCSTSGFAKTLNSSSKPHQKPAERCCFRPRFRAPSQTWQRNSKTMPCGCLPFPNAHNMLTSITI